jgi:prepilin-type N-terminal cleavage/methylation domain-containing protein
MTPQSQGNKGFSLLEVMVGIALITTFFVAASHGLVKVREAQTFLTQKLSARQIMDRNVSELFSAAGSFPALTSGSRMMTYVGCYDKSGVQSPNTSTASRSFIAVIAGYDPTDPSYPSNAGPTDYCKTSKFEVHITPDKNKPGESFLGVFILDPKGFIDATVPKSKSRFTTKIVLEQSI